MLPETFIDVPILYELEFQNKSVVPLSMGIYVFIHWALFVVICHKEHLKMLGKLDIQEKGTRIIQNF